MPYRAPQELMAFVQTDETMFDNIFGEYDSSELPATQTAR